MIRFGDVLDIGNDEEYGFKKFYWFLLWKMERVLLIIGLEESDRGFSLSFGFGYFKLEVFSKFYRGDV